MEIIKVSVILVSFFSIILFILHSYFKRGFRPTFNFFFFSFLFAVLKEEPVRINSLLIKNPALPYEFLAKNTPPLVNMALTVFGWVFTFYLGLSIAEILLRRLTLRRENIFVAAVLSGIITASIGYAVEASAIAIGWWRWVTPDYRMAGILFSAPLIVLETWIIIPVQYLILPYLLIEYSPFKKAWWKGIFFIMPLIHSTVVHFYPHWMTGFDFAFLIILLALSFMSPLNFDYSGHRPFAEFHKRNLFWAVPLLIMLLLLFILAFLDLAKACNSRLLISLLPALFIVMLAVQKIHIGLVVFLNILCLFLFKNEAVLAVLAPLAVVLYKVTPVPNFSRNKKTYG